MLWPHARFRRARNVELQQRVAEARRERPESEAWLGLLEAALGESEAGAGWDAAVPRAAVERPVKAPLLAHAGIAVDGRAARRWVRRLLKVSDRMNPRTIDAVALLEAAVCQDDARSDALAVAAGADPHALRVVGQMAALPLLQACGRALGRDLPGSWWEGYCPLCGVCDETDHESLGYLTPEEGEQMRRVEVCGTCKGYLKAVTTVRPLAPWAILLDDLMTVHLDVAALERGYHRPVRPGYALEARIAERRHSLLRSAFGRSGVAP